jgi:hypothetical protein
MDLSVAVESAVLMGGEGAGAGDGTAEDIAEVFVESGGGGGGVDIVVSTEFLVDWIGVVVLDAAADAIGWVEDLCNCGLY